jgi:hypothetical protein
VGTLLLGSPVAGCADVFVVCFVRFQVGTSKNVFRLHKENAAYVDLTNRPTSQLCMYWVYPLYCIIILQDTLRLLDIEMNNGSQTCKWMQGDASGCKAIHAHTAVAGSWNIMPTSKTVQQKGRSLS